MPSASGAVGAWTTRSLWQGWRRVPGCGPTPGKAARGLADADALPRDKRLAIEAIRSTSQGMKCLMILAAASAMVGAAMAQGIRGVTRRSPTLVPGQMASQFFAAGGLTLNPVNPALATIPGAGQGAVPGARGFVSMPGQFVRPGQHSGLAAGSAPLPPVARTGVQPVAVPPWPSRR